MTEGVQPSFRIRDRPIGGGEDDAGRADRRADRARPRDPHPHGASRLIAGAGDDRRTRRQPRAPRGFVRHAGANLRRFEHRGSSRTSMPTASSRSVDQRLYATSSISVPDASATSIACSPLIRQRM